MPYTVRKGKLYFQPNTGNGPCNRRQVGTYNRRVINGWHVTKGHLTPEFTAREVDPLIQMENMQRAMARQSAKREHRIPIIQRNIPKASVPGSVRRKQVKV